MAFSQKFLLYFITLAVFTIVDLLWVFLISRRLYGGSLDRILRAKFNIVPVVLFYIMFALGLMIFVIVPAFNSNSLWYAIGIGALFGIFTYGTYSLINRATIHNWTQTIMLSDILRGIIVSGVSCAVAFYISQKF